MSRPERQKSIVQPINIERTDSGTPKSSYSTRVDKPELDFESIDEIPGVYDDDGYSSTICLECKRYG